MAVVVAGCGGGTSTESGRAADAAFIADMTVHHEGAIEMARLARHRAEHREIRRMARDIVSAQEAQITIMRHIGGHVGDGSPRDGDRRMGTSHGEMSMAGEPTALTGAEAFDRAFIDTMIPHHEDAIAMAKLQLRRGEHSNLRTMAEDIIDSQTAEIAQLRRWRADWYGSAN